jgi:hypothetical protein
MPTALWVALGLAASAGAFWLLAFRARKSATTLLSASSYSRSLAGPHRPQAFVPERYASRHAVDSAGGMSVCGLSKTEAEDLLDWLEANGFEKRELLPFGDHGFTIRYR